MKKVFLAIAAIIVAKFSFCQEFPKEGTFSEIVNTKVENYSILYCDTGYLNNDNILDLVVVYKKHNEQITSDIIEHPEYRPMLIFIGQKGGKYNLTERNDRAIICIDGGGSIGDPFRAVQIDKGIITILHNGGSGWRWNRITVFKLDKRNKTWLLDSESTDTYHSAEPEKVKTEKKTEKDFGKILFKDFNIYKY